MTTLTVELGDRSYPVYINHNLLTQKNLLTQHIMGKTALIVSNTTVAPLYLKQVSATLGAIKHESVILPDGEKYKNLTVLNQIYDALLAHRLDRNTTIIALGGGVVGDMAGFAAASYQRGVNFIQIPTTLLSQVDSSVGGKTGVNHALGKNMIGAFYQPKAVIADTDTLDTLADRELSAGLSEIIKYGLICDAGFFQWLENNMNALLKRDKTALTYAIKRSCQIKAEIVAADEREGGKRALLNLGHTFGHAIENVMGYGQWLHGEAVGAGICMAANMSQKIGDLSASETKRIIRLVKAAKLPTSAPDTMTKNQFLEMMSVDKKVQDNVIRLVLMKSIGQSVISSNYDKVALNDIISGSIVAND